MSALLVAGVDSSTQSCKVQLRDTGDGRLVASGSAPHPQTFPPRSEQQPEAWWHAFTEAFRTALSQPGAQGGRVVGISVAGQCHGLVPLDAAGQVIRPAKLWNDTTAAAELAGLRRRIGDTAFLEAVGSLPTPAFTIAKLAWLAEHEPENLARLEQILLPHDYLTFRLTGRYVTDRSEASGTGYYDPRVNRYLPEFLNLIAARDWMGMLPSVLGPNEAAGEVLAGVAHELGLEGTVLVGAGGGDQHAAALGLGVQCGDIVYSFGTSGVVSTIHPEAVYDAEGLVNGVADMTDGFMPLVCTMNASKVTDTFTRLLATTHEELSRLALAAPEGPGPVLAAYLDGERSPDRPDATGTITGITTATSREQLARTAFEGVIFGLYRGQENLERIGVDVSSGRVLAVGGGARSAAYTQLLADTVERPVLLSGEDETTARGAAVQAAAVVTGRTVVDVRDAWAPTTLCAAEPRAGRGAREAYERYLSLTWTTSLDRKS